jgi:hypothetical protein
MNLRISSGKIGKPEPAMNELNHRDAGPGCHLDYVKILIFQNAVLLDLKDFEKIFHLRHSLE